MSGPCHNTGVALTALFDKCFISSSKSPEIGHLSMNGVEKDSPKSKNPD